jgi:hypothetical protein
MAATVSSPDHGEDTVLQVSLWSNLQNDGAVKSVWMNFESGELRRAPLDNRLPT